MYKTSHNSLWLTAVAAITFLIASPTAFCDNVFEGNIDTDWNKAGNWDDGVVPPSGDNTNIYDSQTVDLTTLGAEVDAHLRIGNSEFGETATLNIYSGASLLVGPVGGGDDLILGREDLAQSGSLGLVNQIGGDVVISDYLKMSSDKALAAGSHYKISGGTLQIVDQLQMGRDDGQSTLIKFEVDGSNATSIEINDIKQERNASAQAAFSFVIDEFGVTPINVLDELQLGNNESGDLAGIGDTLLELSLSTTMQPPTVIPLFHAGRITMDEIFAGLPDGSLIPVSYSGTDRVYQVNYIDGKDVILTEQVVPEPCTIALAILGTMAGCFLRRSGI